MSSAIFAQRENGSSFGKKRCHARIRPPSRGRPATEIRPRAMAGDRPRRTCPLELNRLFFRFWVSRRSAALHNEGSRTRAALADDRLGNTEERVGIGAVHVPDALAVTELVSVEQPDPGSFNAASSLGSSDMK